MEFDINLEGHSLTHEGKLPEAQEFLLQGHVPIFETPSDHASQLEVLRKTNKLLDRFAFPVQVPNINTTLASILWKNGLYLWSVQVISGEGTLAGYSVMNLGATAIQVVLFDGNDFIGGTPIVQEVLQSYVSKTVPLPTPIKYNNGMLLGFSGTAAAAALFFGSLHIIRE